jgi:hypothetical protein
VREHTRLSAHGWALAAGAIALVAGHGIILRYVDGLADLPAGVLAGIVVLAAVKLGLIGALSARRRRDRSGRCQSASLPPG